MVDTFLTGLMVVLDAEMATLIAPEFGYEPHVDEVAAFDLFPQYDFFTTDLTLDQYLQTSQMFHCVLQLLP